MLAGGMDRARLSLNFNRATGTLSLNYSPIESLKEMQRLYALALSVLGGMRNNDITWSEQDEDKKWDFKTLESKLNQDEWDIDSFMHLLFSIKHERHPFYPRFDKIYHRLSELRKQLYQLKTDDLSNHTNLLLDAYQICSEQGKVREFSTFIKMMTLKKPGSTFPLLIPHPRLMALLNPDDIP